MTDLLTRPPTARSRAELPAGRPLSVSASLAGLGAAGGGLLVAMAIAVTGWFVADGGAHGDTRDALRVGADAWLVGHGSHLTFGGVDYTVVPLGLSVLLAWVAYRAGHWAGSSSALGEDRELLGGAGLMTCSYVVVAVVTSVVAGTTEVNGSLVLALLGCVVLAGGFGGVGIVTGAARWSVVRQQLPGWVWPVVRASLTTLLGFLVCAGALVTASLLLHIGSAASLISRLGLHTGDSLMLVVLSALVAPNAVLLGGSYLLGPGFAVGTGTVVSPSVVALGPLPAFPLLAALPSSGATAWYGTALMALPVLAAAVSVALVQRRHPVLAWDLAALRGLGAGVLAGLAAGLLIGLGGGALGTGRMADIGASVPPVLLAGMLSMGIGGLLGALVTTFFQRRGSRNVEAVDSDGTEDTVELPSGPR
ncbi:MAG: cell division protein PerM [Marmoricola sp.]